MFAQQARTPMLAVLLGCVVATSLTGQTDDGGAADESPWALVIHGGAGSAPADYDAQRNADRHAGLKRALEIGVAQLKAGAAAVDVVEAVIQQLEDDPVFNAGKGAVFNRDGQHELDAAIMDGSTLACGAVGGVTQARYPIRVARAVMTQTPHVLLAGPAADAFASQQGHEMVPNTYFNTPLQKARWEKKRRPAEGGGTVGCVALDVHGNLAAGTSTGGLTNKLPGRIGDTPIIGAGTYADNETCAVSCTGKGEEFMRRVVAYEVAARMKHRDAPLREAADHVVNAQLRPGWGGLIAVDRDGNMVHEYNTRGMAFALADSSGRFEVHWDNDAGPR